ncbi:putative Nudix hydrolase YfcD [Streptomyces sp. YIM 130001]|uniref:NUDIX domain-containing protein n=1 Tax=Streptomyces sp. YIM 130001 TaxID=2259644 RepID=UPI000E64AA7D|nr:NUDIX domain-containing protein [Streptomyces sp. YIM 130001]RII06891.1 putative Nudix hydrolase YfcD [Streptomyces sp. YIM 130001]
MSEWVDRVDGQDEVLAVVRRHDAVRHGWLHRIAAIVCRDSAGRVLVHRRPPDASTFPGHINWLLGGGVGVRETYESAAARELAEEAGVSGQPRFLFKFLCDGRISPYWLAIHEVEVPGPIHPCTDEIDGHAWVTDSELHDLVRDEHFVPDAREAYERYLALHAPAVPQGAARGLS